MENEIFKKHEKQIIKDKIAMKSLGCARNFDNDRAYERFEYVLSQMEPAFRQKFFNRVDYLCKTKFKAKNVYDIYTQYAYDMEINIEKSFIFGVTGDGNVAAMFIRQPYKTYAALFTPGEYKIWEREELERALHSNLPATFDENSDERE